MGENEDLEDRFMERIIDELNKVPMAYTEHSDRKVAAEMMSSFIKAVKNARTQIKDLINSQVIEELEKFLSGYAVDVWLGSSAPEQNKKMIPLAPIQNRINQLKEDK